MSGSRQELPHIMTMWDEAGDWLAATLPSVSTGGSLPKCGGPREASPVPEAISDMFSHRLMKDFCRVAGGQPKK